MKKKVPAALLAALVVGCGSAPEAPVDSGGVAGVQSSAPEWLTETNYLYPESRYIWMIGESSSPEQAKKNAVIELSRQFHTTVEAISEEISEYQETISSAKNKYSDRTRINQYSRIESNEDFFGIRFTDVWFNPLNETYTVLAFINRKEAEEQYRARIETNMVGINALMAAVARSKDPIYSFKLLSTGKSVAGMTRQFIDNMSSVTPGKSQEYLKIYTPYLNTIQRLSSEYEKLRSRMTFSIMVRGDDAGGRVKRAVQKAFEQNKLLIAPNQGEYEVNVTVNSLAKKTPYGKGVAYTIKGGIEIVITHGGKVVFPSYTQNFEEYKKLDQKVVSNLFYRNVEMDLEQNFRAHVAGMLES
ncbi:hypothetical protein AGMMS4952_12440 [Spirochaetia bacterium]|nr:hypothetical protein AGMMS4952_12440 [Spirochaetia bacterium]